MVRNIEIVSLSRGILGEGWATHEVEIGLERLRELGVEVRFAAHAKMGIDYLLAHPEKRAEDLLQAFASDADMILCAIGGDDTYRLLPYLFDTNALPNFVKNKIFLGFSDTTMNHLMLHKVGLPTFYGQAFLPDVCELAADMLPYTRGYFEELLQTGRIAKIVPSDVWYEERTKWGPDQVGVSMPEHPNEGFQLLQGEPRFEGKILGGCLESMYDIWDNSRYPDTVELCEKYGLFPTIEDWKGRILLLETSEECPSPEHYRKMVTAMKKTGIFDVVNGVLMGKPQNELYFEDYKRILVEVIDKPELPIVANINIGHATPRCIIPFGVPATVDAKTQEIIFHYTKSSRRL